MASVAPEVDALLLAFTAALRAAGVPVTPDRGQQFLQATALIGADRRDAVYWSGRATLCAGPDDIERFDQVFASWFGGERSSGTTARSKPRTVRQPELAPDPNGAGEESDTDAFGLRAVASDAELLRHRDVADLGPAERRRLDQRAADAGVPMAEVVRRILDQVLAIDDGAADARVAAVQATAGVLADADDWPEWLARVRGRTAAERLDHLGL